MQEYAKELVYDNHLTMLDGHYEHQFAILNEQMKRINRLYGKVDFIVTDSPILLNNTYLNEDKNTKVYSAYTDCVNKLYGLYNNFNYFVERDTSAFEKEGRIHNLEQSIAIDNELKICYTIIRLFLMYILTLQLTILFVIQLLYMQNNLSIHTARMNLIQTQTFLT